MKGTLPQTRPKDGIHTFELKFAHWERSRESGTIARRVLCVSLLLEPEGWLKFCNSWTRWCCVRTRWAMPCHPPQHMPQGMTHLTRLISAGWLRRGVHARGPCDQLEVALRQGEPQVPGKVSPPCAEGKVSPVTMRSRGFNLCMPIQLALDFLWALGRTAYLLLAGPMS